MTFPSEKPPLARKNTTTFRLHGHTLVDDYAWMRDKSSKDLIGYLEAENSYTESFMKPLDDLQQRLYAEMLSHIKETDESVPYKDGDWLYYTRTVEGAQYAIHCRKSALETNSSEEILLDVNRLAEGQAFMSVGGMAISPDGWLMAYSTDNTGFRQYTLHIRDLRPAKISRTPRSESVRLSGRRMAKRSSTPPRMKRQSALTTCIGML